MAAWLENLFLMDIHSLHWGIFKKSKKTFLSMTHDFYCRFFCCSWLLFSFVIGSSFSGLLKANTFLPPISNNINSFEDINSKGTTKAWVLEDDGHVDTYGILHGNSSDLQKFQSKVNYVNYLNMTHEMHFQWVCTVYYCMNKFILWKMLPYFSWMKSQKAMLFILEGKANWKNI